MSEAAQADAFWAWKARVLELRLGVDAFCWEGGGVDVRAKRPDLAGAAEVVPRLRRQTFKGPAACAAAFEGAAVAVYGREAVEAEISSALYRRCGWPVPEDDFSRRGPFAPPPEVVAERLTRARSHS